MNKKRKSDRRIRRTRRQLHNAVYVLIKEKPYGDMTVSEIVEEADISRATFYLHYTHKDELLLDSTRSLMATALEKLSDDETSADDTMSLQKMAHNLFMHVKAKHDFYDALQTNNLGLFLMQPLTEIISPYIKQLPSDAPLPDLTLNMIAHQIAGSLHGLIMWWLKNNRQPSPKAMSETFYEGVVNGFKHNLNLSDEPPTN